MLNKLFEMLGWVAHSVQSDSAVRRKHVRRPGIQTDVVVANHSYIVRDWSKGGVFFESTSDARMTPGEQVQFTLRFRLPHGTVDITQPGRIIRSAARGIAAEFLPLTAESRRLFDRVIDSMNAQGFLESQAA